MADDPEITDPRDPYKRRDILAELDRWLDNSNDSTTAIERRVVLRARDEIVALRKLTDGDWVWQQITDTRDEALEEAAMVADRWEERPEFDKAAAIAAAIRALKGPSDE